MFGQRFQIALSSAVLAVTSTCRADVLFVKYNSPSPGGSHNTWATAYHSLDDALVYAETHSNIDTIFVASYPVTDLGDGIGRADAYAPSSRNGFHIRAGLRVLGGFEGDETEAGLTTADRCNVDEFALTILTGDVDFDDEFPFGEDGMPIEGCAYTFDTTEGANAFHVVVMDDENADTVLDGFLIVGGRATGEYPDDRGGAIYVTGGYPVIHDCRFQHNYAVYGGGAIYFDDPGAALVQKCQFFCNNAGVEIIDDPKDETEQDVCLFGGIGGAICSEGEDASVFCLGTRFTANHAGGSGGGIFAENQLYMDDCVSVLCAAFTGGGGAIYGDGLDLTASSALFETCSSPSGGAIALSGGTSAVDRALFAGCGGSIFSQLAAGRIGCCYTTARQGGAIYVSNAAGLELTNCTLSLCEAINRGGAVAIQSGSTVDARLCHFTTCLIRCSCSLEIAPCYGENFCDDYTEGHGGAVWVDGTLKAALCHFAGNTAILGGAVFATGELYAAGCNFDQNGFDTQADCDAALHSTHGGAIWFDGDTLEVLSSVFSRNSASGAGGAIRLNTDATGVTLVNDTLSENFLHCSDLDSDRGAAIASLSSTTIELYNSIIWNNFRLLDPEEDEEPCIEIPNNLAGGTYDAKYNCVSDIGDTSFSTSSPYNNIDDDPHFIDAEAFDFRLQGASPCKDTGSNSLLPTDIADLDDNGNTTETHPRDVQYYARVIDTVDRGAFEHSECTLDPPPVQGDADCDGLLTNFDIDPWTVALRAITKCR